MKSENMFWLLLLVVIAFAAWYIGRENLRLEFNQETTAAKVTDHEHRLTTMEKNWQQLTTILGIIAAPIKFLGKIKSYLFPTMAVCHG